MDQQEVLRGVPVIVTKAAPWEGVETYRCGYWCEVDVESLVGALEWMMALSDAERLEMGQCGREWVRREFTWESAAKQMIEVYEKILSANCRS